LRWGKILVVRDVVAGHDSLEKFLVAKGYMTAGTAIVAATRGPAENSRRTYSIFPVEDLLPLEGSQHATAALRLAHLLQSVVAPNDWDPPGERGPFLKPYSKMPSCLFVSNSKEVQSELGRVVYAMRRTLKPRVRAELWFAPTRPDTELTDGVRVLMQSTTENWRDRALRSMGATLVRELVLPAVGACSATVCPVAGATARQIRLRASSRPGGAADEFDVDCVIGEGDSAVHGKALAGGPAKVAMTMPVDGVPRKAADRASWILVLWLTRGEDVEKTL
jgi:hypothetical protein